ncbi:autotransporter-associated beta strand repeat-containing protein [Candidatus Paracaedibacter symbiosus]|uniref:autotransporter-associated beta strand repeat-containing protein n=1 Tax=Candidatus Paracaedibacter symbiosus TaxID=244582 RepID=UPI000690B6D9|nr:autotransporter-associated beta strand repeat-containing protein [Candidatus Paracaedibacter symbiosus]
MNGIGVATLDGENTYTGATIINSGTLALGVNGSIADSTSIDVRNGGTLDVSQMSGSQVVLSGVTTFDLGSALKIGNKNISLSNGIFNGAIQDGGVTGATGASLTMNGANNTDVLALNGANTYSGGTILDNGVIAIGNNQGLGTGTFEFAGTGGATLQLAQALSGPIANAIQMTATGNLDTQGFDVELSGAIMGNATLNKLGSGLLTLSGPNYNNGVIHQNGTIAIGNNQSLGMGSFTFDTAGDIL